MNRVTMLVRSVMLTSVLFGGLSMSAASQDLCAPFEDSQIDDAVKSTMLDAAAAGYLYRIQASTSKVGFCVESKFRRVEGVFRDFRGGIALPSQGAEAGQTVVLIKTDSLDTEGDLVESLIRSPRFFDVKNFPEILFVSNGFEWTGPNRAKLRGNLTLHGVTKPVSFNVELISSAGDKVGEAEDILVRSTATIKRSDFGMDTLSTVVSDAVQLCMSVEAKRYKDG